LRLNRPARSGCVCGIRAADDISRRCHRRLYDCPAYRLQHAAYQLNVIHLLHFARGALGQFGERNIAEHFVARDGHFAPGSQ
jgi:hypothetical protein